MSQQGVQHLSEKIFESIEYCRMEYDMTLAEAVGSLQVAIHELIHMQDADNTDVEED